MGAWLVLRVEAGPQDCELNTRSEGPGWSGTQGVAHSWTMGQPYNSPKEKESVANYSLRIPISHHTQGSPDSQRAKAQPFSSSHQPFSSSGRTGGWQPGLYKHGQQHS